MTQGICPLPLPITPVHLPVEQSNLEAVQSHRQVYALKLLVRPIIYKIDQA
jgi:hypothetical protein